MIEKVTLNNGARLLFEPMDHVRSAAVGFWVGRGSRHEPEALSGITHAIEHMVFKGTHTRTSAQIASEMDAVGGQVNAFTTKECTCYYARVLDEHLPQAIDVLCDIFFSPRMSPGDWALERGVILEEIGMYEDTPEDLVSERLFSAVFDGTPLGRPILGRPATLRKISAGRILSYMQAEYRPQNIVVSLAGRFSPADRQALIARFSTLASSPEQPVAPGRYAPAYTAKHKDIEQNHLCLAWPGLSFRDERRYTLQVLSNILGGGLSSRLFQRVREERGLCYSIYSFATGHEDIGLLGVYTALTPATERDALALLLEVIHEFRDRGPSGDELSRAVQQVKANVLMGLESTAARMNHIGRNELLLGEVPDPENLIEAYNRVSVEDVRGLAAELFTPDTLSFSAVGQVASADRYRTLLSGLC